MKHTVKIIKVELVYVSAATGELINPTENEKLLSSFQAAPTMYSVYLYSCVATVSAKTKTDLERNVWAKAYELELGYDFEVYYEKNI